MRCRRAGRLVVERELGLLRRGPEARRLARHLSACATCTRNARAEARVASELARLRREAVAAEPGSTVDVAARVMREIRSTSATARAGEQARTLGWATATVCAVGLFLVLTLLSALPSAPGLARAAAAALGQAWERMEPVSSALVALPFRLIGPLLELLSGLAALLGRLVPLAYTVSLGGCSAMLATIAVVVARDLALGGRIASRKER